MEGKEPEEIGRILDEGIYHKAIWVGILVLIRPMNTQVTYFFLGLELDWGIVLAMYTDSQ